MIVSVKRKKGNEKMQKIDKICLGTRDHSDRHTDELDSQNKWHQCLLCQVFFGPRLTSWWQKSFYFFYFLFFFVFYIFLESRVREWKNKSYCIETLQKKVLEADHHHSLNRNDSIDAFSHTVQYTQEWKRDRLNNDCRLFRFLVVLGPWKILPKKNLKRGWKRTKKSSIR